MAPWKPKSARAVVETATRATPEAATWRPSSARPVAEGAGAVATPSDDHETASQVRSGLSGATLGWADEGLGYLESRAPVLAKEPAAFIEHLRSRPLDVAKQALSVAAPFAADALGIRADQPGPSYTEARDANRKTYDAAVEQHPVANVAGSMLAPIPLGKAKGLARAGEAVLSGGLVGGLSAAGHSNTSDLSKLAADTGKGIGVGSVLGAGAGALSAGLAKAGRRASELLGDSRFIQFLRSKAGAAKQEALDKAAAAVDEGIASQQGSYRSAVQSASRDLEVLARESAEGTGEVAERARQFLASPEAQALREQVAGNKLVTAPERVSEMSSKLEALQKLAGSRDADVASKTADILSNPIKKQVVPRIATLGHRMLPLATTGLGYAIAGEAGGALGGAAGAILALTQGRPGIVARNIVRSPAVRSAAFDALSSTLTKAPESFGRWSGRLIEAAARGPEALLAEHTALAEDDDYRSTIERVFGQQQSQ